MSEEMKDAMEGLPSVERVLPFEAIAVGREEAGDYVDRIVGELTVELGFGFVGSIAPPMDRASTERALARSATFGVPLPVRDHRAESSMLVGAKTDLKLEFWRSITRMRRSLDFTLGGDLLVDLTILDQAAFDGESTRCRMTLYAALVGTTMHRAVLGREPDRPRAYVADVLTYGLSDAILLATETQTSRRAR